MFDLSISKLALILIIGLVVFGPGKLPEVGRALGKSINEFKKATAELTSGLDKKNEEPADSTKKAASTQNIESAKENSTEMKSDEKK